MDDLIGIDNLLTEILQKVYGCVKDIKDRKTWQLVCRKWYYTANDSARIHVKVPENTRLSLEDLFDDLERHPIFGTKILFITDRASEGGAANHLAFERFHILSYACPFLGKVCLNSWSLKMFHKYLKLLGSQQTSPIHLKELKLVDPTDDFTVSIYLQICYALRMSLTKLDVYLIPNGIVEEVLDRKYGGLVGYTSEFSNLKQLKVVF